MISWSRGAAAALLMMAAPSCERDLPESVGTAASAAPPAARSSADAESSDISAPPGPTWTAPALPGGSFRAVSMGADGGCALDEEGRLHCWGEVTECLDEGREALPVPAGGGFESMTGSPQEGCALDGQGHASCWGCARVSDSGATPETKPRFRVIARASEERFCGIRSNGTLAGCHGLAQTTVELDQDPPRGAVIAADACWYSDAGPLAADACAVLSDGSLDCWGLASYERDEHRLQKGPYTSVAVAACRRNICMIESGRIECRDGEGPRALPGPATKLVAGHSFHCALAGNEVLCFDRSGGAPAALELGGSARDVAAHGGAACALDTRGRLRCAGAGYTRPPSVLECGG